MLTRVPAHTYARAHVTHAPASSHIRTHTGPHTCMHRTCTRAHAAHARRRRRVCEMHSRSLCMHARPPARTRSTRACMQFPTHTGAHTRACVVHARAQRAKSDARSHACATVTHLHARSTRSLARSGRTQSVHTCAAAHRTRKHACHTTRVPSHQPAPAANAITQHNYMHASTHMRLSAETIARAR